MRESRCLSSTFWQTACNRWLFAQPHAAVDEQRVVRLPRLLGNGQRRRVRQPVARPGDEILEDVVGIQGQRLFALIEHAAAGKIVAMEADGNQLPRHRLRRVSEGLLALALAEVELGGRVDRGLNHAVGELPGRNLVKPGPMQGGMLGADVTEDLPPDGGVQCGDFQRAANRVARNRR